jgi:hypothetical protein
MCTAKHNCAENHTLPGGKPKQAKNNNQHFQYLATTIL